MYLLIILYLLIAIGVSFLCSLLEASLLSVPRSHVVVMIERGSRAGHVLAKMKDDIDRPLAAILTLNTFAHTLGAAGVGAQAVYLWGEAWLGLVSFGITLIILIFSEIIPKTLGAVHAKRLAAFTAWTVHILIKMLWPLVAVCNGISKVLAGKNRSVPMISREEVSSFALLAHDEGVIDQTEARVMRNLIALRGTTVESVMTPRTVVCTLQADQSVREVTDGQPLPFSRAPVIGESLDDIRGVLHRHDLFKARNNDQAETLLGELAGAIHAVPEVACLPDVLEEFLQRREHLFLVVDEYGGTAGIITLEDVLETLLGAEIVDETDAVEDMQELAKQLHDDRRHQQDTEG